MTIYLDSFDFSITKTIIVFGLWWIGVLSVLHVSWCIYMCVQWIFEAVFRRQR